MLCMTSSDSSITLFCACRVYRCVGVRGGEVDAVVMHSMTYTWLWHGDGPPKQLTEITDHPGNTIT